jgi:hypothetical protein
MRVNNVAFFISVSFRCGVLTVHREHSTRGAVLAKRSVSWLPCWAWP